MELFKASHQWSTRPPDERFWNLTELRAACAGYRASAATATVHPGDLRVQATEGEVELVGRAAAPARLTHFAFGQLSRLVDAPPSYLRTVPPTLAAQCLNYGLKARGEGGGDDVALLFHHNGGLLLRAATSTGYARVWNDDIAARLLPLAADGWRVPPAWAVGDDPRARPATEADCGPHTVVKPGDTIGPAGVYASDKDMFAYLVSEQAVRNPLDPTKPLFRGFFTWNSEVGDKSFGIATFLHDFTCGNHIVWGARDVREVRIRHVGVADERSARALAVEVRRYASESASDDEARIAACQTKVIGASKDEAIDAAFRFLRGDLSRRVLDDAYATAERTPRYGDPRTPWALAQGVTEASQASPYGDERTRLDRAAGKLLTIAF